MLIDDAGGSKSATSPSAVESVPCNYYKIILENKDVMHGVMMLSSCTQTVKNYVAKALANLSYFSFLYFDDKEKFVEVTPVRRFGAMVA